MLLWVLLAALSAAVVIALLQPLLKLAGQSGLVGQGSHAVYRDQLAEIDAEHARGLIGLAEAEAAKLEISRRMIAADAEPDVQLNSNDRTASGVPGQASPRPVAVTFAIAAMAILPVAAIGLYAISGAPSLPSQPLAARRQSPPVTADVQNLVNAVEARLKQTPDDGRGWDVIAPVYMRLARYQDAANAYRQSLKLNGESAARLSGLGEALMLAGQGTVPADARRAFERIVQLEPRDPRARFWLAYAKELDGGTAEAASEYASILADLPANIPWRSMVEERYQATRSAKSATQPSAAPGPTASDIEAAGKLDESSRRQMIEGMVSGLAARLEKEGGDVAGWQRLIRAQTVLGRRDDAVASLAKARSALAGQPEALLDLAELAQTLGLGS